MENFNTTPPSEEPKTENVPVVNEKKQELDFSGETFLNPENMPSVPESSPENRIWTVCETYKEEFGEFFYDLVLVPQMTPEERVALEAAIVEEAVKNHKISADMTDEELDGTARSLAIQEMDKTLEISSSKDDETFKKEEAENVEGNSTKIEIKNDNPELPQETAVVMDTELLPVSRAVEQSKEFFQKHRKLAAAISPIVLAVELLAQATAAEANDFFGTVLNQGINTLSTIGNTVITTRGQMAGVEINTASQEAQIANNAQYQAEIMAQDGIARAQFTYDDGIARAQQQRSDDYANLNHQPTQEERQRIEDRYERRIDQVAREAQRIQQSAQRDVNIRIGSANRDIRSVQISGQRHRALVGINGQTRIARAINNYGYGMARTGLNGAIHGGGFRGGFGGGGYNPYSYGGLQ
jgi:hypothetical protein